MIRPRLALQAALIIVHCAVFILIIISMIEAFRIILGIIPNLDEGNKFLLTGALIAALLPSGAVLFWGCVSIPVQLDLPLKWVCRYVPKQSRV